MENYIRGITLVTEGQLVSLLVFCVAALTFVIATWLTRRRRLRAISSMAQLRLLLSRSVEARSRVHLALGSGHIGGRTTIETTAGLTLLKQLAKQSAQCETPLTVSVADPTTLAAAQGILYEAAESSEHPGGSPAATVQFVAPDPMAYASGAAQIISEEKPALDIMVGTYGPEYLLVSEAGSRDEASQIAGATNPEALALMHATADETLIGEEMLALGAYLGRPMHLGSLTTEDVLRIITAALILIGVVSVSLRF